MLSIRCTLWVAMLGLAGPGCSFVVVDAPPPNPAQLRYFDCTSSRFAPVTDTVLAGILGISAASIATDSQNSSGSQDLVTSMVVTAAFVASAVRGYSATSDCRQAKQELQVRLMDQVNPQPATAPRSHGDPWLSGGPPPGYPDPPPPPSKPGSDSTGDHATDGETQP